jgi:ribonucleoside-diphosphate reductase alpha chain
MSNHSSGPEAARQQPAQEIEPPHRRRLPATRPSLTHKFTVNGHEGYITVGFFEDGQPGEVFIKMAKKGSTIRGLTDSIGLLTSLALQHGVPLELLAAKFENTRFEPLGWTKNPQIREATSLVDYIFRWLRLETCPST